MGLFYNAARYSSRKSITLPKSHALNAYDNHEKLKNDLILYTKLVHKVDIEEKIMLDNNKLTPRYLISSRTKPHMCIVSTKFSVLLADII